MIETRNLTKRYGDLIAANQITLSLEEGDVFGFIGPNGSGKTTTMRMIATLLNPDYGEAYICGKSIYTDAREIRPRTGHANRRPRGRNQEKERDARGASETEPRP